MLNKSAVSSLAAELLPLGTAFGGGIVVLCNGFGGGMISVLGN